MFFAKLHPLIVHFPVGLLVSGALFEMYGKLTGEESSATAGWFNVRLGFWCALVAMAVGLLGILSLEVLPKFKPYLGYHILSAFTTVALFLMVLILGRFGKKTWTKIAYHLFLFMGLISVLATGYFGGELVHRFGLPNPTHP